MMLTQDTGILAVSCGIGPEWVTVGITETAIQLPRISSEVFPHPSTVTFDVDVSYMIPYASTNLSLVLKLKRTDVAWTYGEETMVNIDVVTSRHLVVSMTTVDLPAEGDDYYLKSWVVPTEYLNDELWYDRPLMALGDGGCLGALVKIVWHAHHLV
jgi:hypothetical protein